jgi:hypothetical protein
MLMDTMETPHNSLTLITENNPVLSNDILDVMTQELALLEKNPCNGWNATYPTLYSTLFKIIEEISTTYKHKMPDLFIVFTGINKHQALAQIMTDGSTQIYLGTDFIRTYLLNPSARNSKTYQAFRWIIAHEVGHLCDPGFKFFAQLFSLRFIIDKSASMLFVGSLAALPFSYNNPDTFIWATKLFTASTLFIIGKKVTLTLLQRKFEYAADALSVKGFSQLDFDTIKTALTNITNAIKSSYPNPYENSNNTIMRYVGNVFKKLTLFNLFIGSPSIDKRIKRLQKAHISQ